MIVLGCVLLVFLRGCALRPASRYLGSHFNHGKNGMWLGVEWVNEPHADAEFVGLANDLARRQIRYVFVYTSHLRTDTGAFNNSYAHAAEFLHSFKKAQPSLKVLAWLGLPMPSLGGIVNLADAAIRQQIVTLSTYLVKTVGFDGIQLDPETVADGDQGLVKLLDESRSAIGSGKLLSLAAEKIQPLFPDQSIGGPFVGWSNTYYRQIAGHLDQIAVMTYAP